MALLIDGYNLLHVTDIFGEAGPGTDLHRSRFALLDFLALSLNERERAETTIVFDAAGAPPGLPRTIVHDRMTVRFARGYADADAMIEELLEQYPAPRALVVVSGDRRVQRAARHRGASFVDSEQWYAELLAARRETAADEAAAKPSDEVSPEEVAHWLHEFELPPTERGRENVEPNPFPPGYGEDVQEDD